MTESAHPSILDSALKELLPLGVECAVRMIPEEAAFEYSAEEQAMRTAGEYRKREFVSGRNCAREALARLDFPQGPILADDFGVPVWPEGSLAVISHSRGYCSGIAADSLSYRALGLDLEQTNRLSASAIERVVHRLEQDYVQGDQKKATLMFCAKEAFFKAQFPIWQTHANFKDIAFAVDPDKGALTIQHIAERFPQELRLIAPQIRFRFSFFEDFVISICWLSKSD